MFKTLFFVLLASVAVNADIINKLEDAVVKDISNEDFSFEKLKGKCVLVVNTASECAFSDKTISFFSGRRYRHSRRVAVPYEYLNIDEWRSSKNAFTNINMNYLNVLKERHPDLEIVAFPSNTFGQEPKDKEELKNWFFEEWKAKYHVMEKTNVRESDIYKFLNQRAGVSSVNQNFVKYVVEKDGLTVNHYSAKSGSIWRNGLDEDLERCVEA